MTGYLKRQTGSGTMPCKKWSVFKTNICFIFLLVFIDSDAQKMIMKTEKRITLKFKRMRSAKFGKLTL